MLYSLHVCAERCDAWSGCAGAAVTGCLNVFQCSHVASRHHTDTKIIRFESAPTFLNLSFKVVLALQHVPGIRCHAYRAALVW